MKEQTRRDRFNRSMEELIELVADELQTKSLGDNVDKPEKADVLELTVKHLYRLLGLCGDSANGMDQFRHGYERCVFDVAQFMGYTPGLNMEDGIDLMNSLSREISSFEAMVMTETAATATATAEIDALWRSPSPPSLRPQFGTTGSCQMSPNSCALIRRSFGTADVPPNHIPPAANQPVWRPW